MQVTPVTLNIRNFNKQLLYNLCIVLRCCKIQPKHQTTERRRLTNLVSVVKHFQIQTLLHLSATTLHNETENLRVIIFPKNLTSYLELVKIIKSQLNKTRCRQHT